MNIRVKVCKILFIVVLWVATVYFYAAVDLEVYWYLYNEARVRTSGAARDDGIATMDGHAELMTHTALSQVIRLLESNDGKDKHDLVKPGGEVSVSLENVLSNLNSRKPQKVIITCLTRDDYYGLYVNRYQVEELGRSFMDYRVIIVENDSQPDYLESLDNWAEVNPKVVIIKRKYWLKKRPDLRFLAKMRNFYVDEIRKPEYDSFNKVIVYDMDISHRWPVRKMVGAALIPDRDVAVRCLHVYNRGFTHRDVLAFRAPDVLPEYEFSKFPDSASQKTIHDVYRVTQKWHENKETHYVESCFGGIAIYSTSVFRECRYDETDFNCEHVPLNKCIRQSGKKLVLDTSVAIPVHERTVVEGLLLLLLSKLPQMFLVTAPGILRNSWRAYHRKRRSIQSLNALIEIMTGGVTVLIWFVFFAKNDTSDPDRDSRGWLRSLLFAAVLEPITKMSFQLLRSRVRSTKTNKIFERKNTNV